MKTDLGNNNLMLADVSLIYKNYFPKNLFLKYQEYLLLELLRENPKHVAVFYLYFMTNKILYLAGNKRIIGIC